MKKNLLISLSLCAAACGCGSPAQTIIGHFAAMNETARAKADDCGAMASALSAYLDGHSESFAQAVLDAGGSEPSESREILRQSAALHLSTERCRDRAMTDVRQKLADIVLQSTKR